MRGVLTEAVPKWRVKGDWFDACKCTVPCPCEFGEAPTFGDCDGVWAYHIVKGHYGDVELDGLNAIGVHHFEGNVWAGGVKIDWGYFFDERGTSEQREALRMIFTGEAGGHPGELSELTGEVRGVEFVPIEVRVAKDLVRWEAEIPEKVVAKVEALGGPGVPEGGLVQLVNPPGSERGPGLVATWGKASANSVIAYGFRWDLAGRASKHIPFDWRGP